MDIDRVEKLLQLIKDTDITEIEVEEGEWRIKLVRGDRTTSTHPPVPPRMKEETLTFQELKQEETSAVTITSPIVGTFYRTPSPNADSFVEVGDRVRRGQVLCIIEAMKLLNEIESDVDGVVLKVLVDNESPVEYGEPLFLIEPNEE